MKKSIRFGLVILAVLSFCTLSLFAQETSTGRLSGSFQANVNFFQRDSAIGAANTPGYDRQLLGNESWLNLDYSNWGFD
ncbi:MAG: hypothetical protein KA479_09925, partial [Saprospiraceae bacterium]|nr:hypothetical protein [Saprospiraceae bacterium]